MGDGSLKVATLDTLCGLLSPDQGTRHQAEEQVKALEDAVGGPLFVRLTRALALTDTGRAASSDTSVVKASTRASTATP